MASATDVITYIGIPLAVLGVLPIFYTFLSIRAASATSSYTMATNPSPLPVPIASSPSQTAAPAVDLTPP